MQTKPLWIKACEALMAAMLAIMVVMVFGNVVLRYGFNKGIVVSEEAARFLFVWLTFIGAIVAMRENAHLGVDSLVRMANTQGKKWMYGISSALMLACCVLLFIGSYKQTVINWTVPSAVLEVPQALLYGIGMVAAAGIGFIIAANLVRLLMGTLPDDELVQTSDSEEIGADGEGDHAAHPVLKPSINPAAKT
jgi:TRAP-type C4-dicarboxylate transport system permease small subunit